ncbi:prepilin-type N-terminal cleavage/methylation domain-containing protein [Oxalobacteraceae bacterium OM1]|nr:prepilin-type N-terminal cleavage/methylation domain-containing protein [Oxalobacteraceae bacterium OM1]
MKAQQGFTLIELMIVVAIIGILAAVAIPAYQQYTLKARFTEVVASTSALKTGVEVCAQNGSCVTSGALAGISAGVGDIPAVPASTAVLASVAIGDTGTITATATTANGLNAQTYVLTPTLNSTTAQVTWATSGSCASGSPKLC